MKKITSLKNKLIKEVLKIQSKSSIRKEKKLFLVEGKREINLIHRGNYQIKTILYLSSLFSFEELKKKYKKSIDIIEVSNEVYKKIAYRNSTEGIIAIVNSKSFYLSDIKFETKNPLILVLESIEKPGNIGAMLRTADAAKIDAVLIADPKTDIYNPNIIRSSVGCLFSNQIGIGSSNEIIDFLKKNKIKIFTATLQNSNIYTKENYKQSSAIVVGSEYKGLTQTWRNNITHSINIPMQGKIDSMNVSVSCAIIIFEALRQRGFKNCFKNKLR